MSVQQNVFGFSAIAAVVTLPVRSEPWAEMAPVRGANKQEYPEIIP